MVKPPKPISEMSEEELDEFADRVSRLGVQRLAENERLPPRRAPTGLIHQRQRIVGELDGGVGGSGQ